MTLYDLVNSVTIQGNVKIQIYDLNTSEYPLAYYKLIGVDDLSWLNEYDCDGRDAAEANVESVDLGVFEDYEVNYIFSDKDNGGREFVVIELEATED